MVGRSLGEGAALFTCDGGKSSTKCAAMKPTIPKDYHGPEIHCACTELVAIEAVTPNPRNPNTHPKGQIELLAKIIAAQGWRNPVVVSDRSGFVIKGHGRLAAAKVLKASHVPVDRQHYDSEAQEWADMIADNRIAELAEIDTTLLKDLIGDMDTGAIDLALTGYTQEEIEQLLAGTTDRNPDDAPDDSELATALVDEADRLLIKWGVQDGDLWEIGPHRVLCGDSLDPAALQRVMDGKIAGMVWTDPPYGVDYADKETRLQEARKNSRKKSDVANDDLKAEELKAFLRSAFANAIVYTIDGGAIYVSHADMTGIYFRMAVLEAGWFFKQSLVWVKNNHVLGRQDYQWMHEPIIYGWKPGAAHRWFVGHDQRTVFDDQTAPADMTKAQLVKEVEAWRINAVSTVIREAKPQSSGMHPTMKPPPLIARMIRNSSEPADIVLDMFAGSGSTAIAAHAMQRRARMIEKAPKYVAVILEMMAQTYNITPKKLS